MGLEEWLSWGGSERTSRRKGCLRDSQEKADRKSLVAGAAQAQAWR